MITHDSTYESPQNLRKELGIKSRKHQSGRKDFKNISLDIHFNFLPIPNNSMFHWIQILCITIGLIGCRMLKKCRNPFKNIQPFLQIVVSAVVTITYSKPGSYFLLLLHLEAFQELSTKHFCFCFCKTHIKLHVWYSLMTAALVKLRDQSIGCRKCFYEIVSYTLWNNAHIEWSCNAPDCYCVPWTN